MAGLPRGKVFHRGKERGKLVGRYVRGRIVVGIPAMVVVIAPAEL